MLIMRRQTSSQQSYSPSATSRFRAATISAARSTPKKSKVLQNGRPSCPPTSNLLGSLSVSRCIEAVAQYFSNPTVGFNGCPGQTVHFLVSQTPFIHFFIWNSVWLINQAKLHVKASKTAALSIPVGLTAWPQLQQVMPSADQPPLATTNFKSWPHKLVTAASSLNFPNTGATVWPPILDHRWPRSVKSFYSINSVGDKLSAIGPSRGGCSAIAFSCL